MLRQHLHQFGSAPDGRLFPGARSGMLSESVYDRAWHAARHAALSPEPAATPLASPYDLRHAALPLWAQCHRRARRSRRPGRDQRPRPFVGSTCTAPTAKTTSSASGSKTPARTFLLPGLAGWRARPASRSVGPHRRMVLARDQRLSVICLHPVNTCHRLWTTGRVIARTGFELSRVMAAARSCQRSTAIQRPRARLPRRPGCSADPRRV